MTITTDKTFGEPVPGADYYHRIGAYLILVRDGYVGAVRISKGYLLPGGGVEGDESHEECLWRECLEEIGQELCVEAES